ncbi:MAG: cobalamin biosynthesis protein [Isosphaeraceae bacterium]|nr:cobalamin biosynthesis protein [Isosphaeraceae bacterium]
MKTAVLVLSQAGLGLARRLRAARPEETAIYGPSCVVGACGGLTTEDAAIFPTTETGVFGWVGPLRRVFPTVWNTHDEIVAVMALGIVVRLAGPLALDKRTDPAVVAVDDAGQFAVSVLGGHGAGANALAERVADVLRALPVITTASEAQRLPAVDRIGRTWGWAVERTENFTRVAAAVVRRECVAVWQDAGHTDWWHPFGPWPQHFVRLSAPGDVSVVRPSAVLVISDRAVPPGLPDDRTIVYRPPTLVAGVGCRRGATREAIDAWTESVFAAHGLSPLCIAAVATVHLKLDEPGLLAFARGRGLPLVSFPAESLAETPGIERPSERVRAKVGIAAVAEPAALRGAGATRLLVPKQIGPGVTLAVARRTADEARHQA